MAEPTVSTVTLDWPADETLMPDGSLPPVPALPLATEGIEIGEMLGEGASATVHRARHALLERDVAIKRLKHGSTDRALGRLLQEGRTMGSLEHPNIVPVHAVGVDRTGRPALVMKRVDGEPWEPGDLERDLRVLIDCCAALGYAHERGMVHRDLKPANVLIGPHDEVYLGDWGIAAAIGARMPPGGTPWYMAPEMFQVSEAHPAMDVYQVGACLHRMLTGRPRNTGDTFQECLASAGRATEIQGDPELVALVESACAALPQDRPALDEVRERLDAWLRSRPTARLAQVAAARLAVLKSQDQLDAATLTECLFAYRQVVEQRPGHYEAGLAAALRTAIQDAIDRDVHAELAPAWLDELAALDEDVGPLREALSASLQRQQDRAVRAWDADFQVDYRERFRAYAVWLGLFGALVGCGAALGVLDHETHAGSFAVAGLFTTTLALTAWRRWATLTRNRANRVMLAALFLMGGLMLVSRGVAWRLDAPVPWMHAVDAGLLGAVTLTLGFTFGPVTRWIGGAMLAGVPLILVVPEGYSAVAFVGAVAAAPIGFLIAGMGAKDG